MAYIAHSFEIIDPQDQAPRKLGQSIHDEKGVVIKAVDVGKVNDYISTVFAIPWLGNIGVDTFDRQDLALGLALMNGAVQAAKARSRLGKDLCVCTHLGK